MRPLYLFLGVLKNIDVPRYVHCITKVGEHVRGYFDNVERMYTSVTQLEMIHGHLGDDVVIDGIGVPEITDPCVFDGVNDEGVTATFSSFVKIEIVPKQFWDGIREGAVNGSGVVGYDWVDDVSFGRVKHFVL